MKHSLHINLIKVNWAVLKTVIWLMEPVPGQSAHHSKTWYKGRRDSHIKCKNSSHWNVNYPRKVTSAWPLKLFLMLYGDNCYFLSFWVYFTFYMITHFAMISAKNTFELCNLGTIKEKNLLQRQIWNGVLNLLWFA
jgi:hypothetical protein